MNGLIACGNRTILTAIYDPTNISDEMPKRREGGQPWEEPGPEAIFHHPIGVSNDAATG